MIDQCNFQEFRNHHGNMVDIDFEFHARDVPAGIAEGAIEAIDEFKFRMTAPDRESPKATPKPDPDLCEECSPPPAPVAAKLKKKYSKPEKKPAAKQTGKITGGRLLTCPFCQRQINSHGMHIHVRQKHPEKFEGWLKEPDRLQHGIHKPMEVKATGKSEAIPGKWQIPFNSKTDQQSYNKAYAMCRLYNLPYPEALKKAQEQGKSKIKKERLPFHQKKPDKVATESPQSDLPASPGTSPVSQLNCNNITMDTPVSDIITGVHVRQVRPDAGRQIFGTGMVVARHGEIASVRNGNGKTYKILAACLEVVTSPHQGEEKPAGETA